MFDIIKKKCYNNEVEFNGTASEKMSGTARVAERGCHR